MKKIILTLTALASLTIASFAGQGVTKDGYLATSTKADLDELMEYCVHKDVDAVQAMGNEGRCIALRAGIKVQVLEHSWGEVKCRASGTTTTFWTVQEAVNEN